MAREGVRHFLAAQGELVEVGGLGAEVATSAQTTPEYLAKLVKDETEKWAVPIKASGVSVE